MDKINILVVDDKRVAADLFQFTLGAQGCAVRYAGSAAEATECLQEQKFDIAFLDVVMPGVDGLMLLKKIKAVTPSLPVVMMSGFNLLEKQKKESQKLGAVAVLKKPFEMAEVMGILRRVLKVEV